MSCLCLYWKSVCRMAISHHRLPTVLLIKRSTIITKDKLLIKIPSLNLCQADWHPFINGHHLMFIYFNHKYTQKYVMSVHILAKHVLYGHFPLSSTNCAIDKKYLSLIGRVRTVYKGETSPTAYSGKCLDQNTCASI